MRPGSLLFSTLLLLIATQAAAQDSAPRPLALDDVIDMAQVSGPKISPDGSRVLYRQQELDWPENKREGRIWIVGTDGSGARVFTGSKDDQNPEWSPDGRWVSFTRPVGDDTKVRQLFLLPTDGGEAVQLTKHPTAVGRYRWGSSSNSLYFLANDSLPDDVEKERKNGDDTVFIDEGPNGQTRGEWNGVWQIRAMTDDEPAEATRLTPEGRKVGDYAPSPDGNHIAYTYRGENRRNDGNLSEIALLSTATNDEVMITQNQAPESNLAWSPDGRTITFVAPDLETWELDQGNLYAYDIPREAITELLPGFEGDMRSYRWNPGGQSIEFDALVRTDTNLFRLDVRSGEVEALTEGTGIMSAVSYDAGHNSVAYQYVSPTQSGDLWFRDLASEAPVRLTEANPAMSDRILVEPELVRWNSSDGMEIEGILYQPERSQPGAFVLEIHGGPAGVFTRSFDSDAQLMVAQGYAVLQPNVRGSSGYGDELLRGNMEDIGGGDYQDLMTGVDAMIERGVAHPDSLAVKGWSYGGILGGWTITQTDRFKAASLGAMVADWRSEFGTGFNFDVVRWYLGGDPWSNKEQWTERSAYTHLDKVKTPTILFHGAEDTTDTMEQSMNYFAGLRHLGVEARFLLFPREGHGIREPRHRRTMMVEEMRWLNRYVKGLEDWEPPTRPTEEDEKKAAVIS
ncbi:MAG: prolyl oligopeptidase family serine peptidase [Longimicrobiales bacterium]